ncbi:Formate--tetrahydrofolate ligase [Dirofilaria immitis]
MSKRTRRMMFTYVCDRQSDSIWSEMVKINLQLSLRKQPAHRPKSERTTFGDTCAYNSGSIARLYID